MKKILLLRGGALGDFVVTLPALALLRHRWPASRIELAGNPTAAQLGLSSAITRQKISKRLVSPAQCHLIDDIVFPVSEGDKSHCHSLDDNRRSESDVEERRAAMDTGLLDAVHSQHEARWSALYGNAALPAGSADWLAEFDLVVNYWPDPDGELRRRFPLRDGQIFISAPAMPTVAPAAVHYCEPLRALGLETRNYFYPLTIARNRSCNGLACIAIHPGSGSPRKNWPLERWSALCAWLRTELRVELLIVTGEVEDSAGGALARFGQTARNLPLVKLAAELGRCQLFLGHDSGVSHLAAACGIPCVLLFGPTDPAMWAPPAPHVRVLRREAGLDSISSADVQVAVRTALADRR